ncbi:DEKNAAC103356 [Brettanomyces naardenensis]|uniref:Calcium-binding protein NCS-1 n=1 Tax=Brettanomyces naardenensis TaxID=13370 RepID=A0A448YN34_BRENA|nr:DEKNAAC103356 [Brettanomyces naardenensis]
MGQQASKLNKEDISNLKQETKFTTRELQQWYKGFKRDAPTGKLTKEDFIKIHRQFYPFGDPTDFATFAFEAIDVNSQGYIDFKDFIISLSIASRGSMPEKLKWTFKMYDRDKDGFISYDDLLRVVRSIYTMTGTECVTFKDEDITAESRVGKIWVGFHKSLGEKDSGRISLGEFSDYKRLDPEALSTLGVYNDLV